MITITFYSHLKSQKRKKMKILIGIEVKHRYISLHTSIIICRQYEFEVMNVFELCTRYVGV
jgi:hypothetical protein